jgi:hypothetical protein
MQTPNVAAKIVGDFVAAHDPDYSATVQNATRLALAPTAQASSFASATGSFPVSAAAGKRIHFSGYIKTEDVDDGYAGLWWRADGSGQTRPLAFDNMQDRGAKGSTEWKKFDLELAIPAETRNINFGALLAGNGTAWFDGLAVDIDGVPYKDDSVFGFLHNNTQQGPYQLRLDSQAQREGHPTLMIRRSAQAANAVDPKRRIRRLARYRGPHGERTRKIRRESRYRVGHPERPRGRAVHAGPRQPGLPRRQHGHEYQVDPRPESWRQDRPLGP